jgi:DedD protein
MQDQEELDVKPDRDEKQVEFQLGGRHLTLAVLGLAVFGVVLFLLGRWSERVGRPAPVEAGGGIEAPLEAADGEPAPRELTFYETLGKKASPGFQESARPAARGEQPAVLPESAPAAPPVAKSSRPSPKPAEAAPPAPAGANERFRIQVASTRDAAAARQLADRLRRKGFAASLESVQGTDGKTQYKVRIGNYSEREPAEAMASRIRTEEKVGAWIVRVQG